MGLFDSSDVGVLEHLGSGAAASEAAEPGSGADEPIGRLLCRKGEGVIRVGESREREMPVEMTGKTRWAASMPPTIRAKE